MNHDTSLKGDLKELHNLWMKAVKEVGYFHIASRMVGETFIDWYGNLDMKAEFAETQIRRAREAHGRAVRESEVWRVKVVDALRLHSAVYYDCQLICRHCSGYSATPSPSVDLGMCPYPCPTVRILNGETP